MSDPRLSPFHWTKMSHFRGLYLLYPGPVGRNDRVILLIHTMVLLEGGREELGRW